MDFGISSGTSSSQMMSSTKNLQDQQPMTVDYIRAKRREVEKRLEALLALQAQVEKEELAASTGTCTSDSVNRSSSRFQPGDACGWPSIAPLKEQEVAHTRANATFGMTAGAAVAQNMANSNGDFLHQGGDSSNSNMLEAMEALLSPQGFAAPQQPQESSLAPQHTSSSGFGVVQEQISQAHRVVSNGSLDDFVVSDRLAEILPDLDMTGEPLPDEDNEGLMQFFQDSSAWDQPTPVTSSGPSLPRLTPRVTAEYKPRQQKPRKARSSSASGNRKLGRPSAFPQKLYRMLTEIRQQDSSLCDVVGFTPDGSAFEIYHNDAFVTQVLPKFFKMSSFSSFQRQLQLYNFKRVSKGGAYHHPMFHRDMPESVGKMVRKQSKPSPFAMTIAAQSA